MKKILYIIIIIIIAIAAAIFLNGNNVFAPGEDTEGLTVYMMAQPDTQINDLPDGYIEIEGCGPEFAVPVVIESEEEPTIQNALNELFSIKENEYEGYYNSLYMAELEAEVDEQNMTVNLIGEPISAGHCDTPRFKGQIETTINHYVDPLSSQTYEILLNGEESLWRCLGDESGFCN